MKSRRSAGYSGRDREGAQIAAEELAVAALTFIAGEPERLGRFLALSGIGPESIRAAAREPDFLLGVLDHLAGDETLLMAFAEESGIDPGDIELARRALAERPSKPRS
jgi:Protein of unknown function (DUF3572)